MANNMFEKRSGTTDKGKDYEDLITAQLAMKLAADENIKSFHLSSNDKNFGIFDDVVLELETTKGNCRKYALQLKHVNKGGKLPERTLTSPTGNFSVQKYFTEYTKLKNAKHPITDFKLVLFTNYTYELHTEQTITLKNISFVVKILKCELFDEFKQGFCYTFEIDKNKKCTKEETEKSEKSIIQEYEGFFKQFYLYTNQGSVDMQKQDIFQTFRQTFYCEDDAAGELYLNFIREWSQSEGRKIKLNKTFMQRVIGKILLSPFVKPFSFTPYPEHEQSKLLKEAILNFNVTVVKSTNFDKIQSIWGDFKNELNNIEKIGKTANLYQICSKKMDNKTKSILLWIMDVCPLMISENKTTYEAINLCQNGKFILLADSLSKKNIKNISIFRNLSDLNQESQNYKNIVKTFKFSIQGREEITLQTLIEQHDEFRNIITTNELFQMLEGSFRVGGEKEELPEIYIDRMLTKNIIDYEFLNDIKDDTIVIMSYFGKFDMIKGHLKKFNIININGYVNKNEDIAVNNTNQGFKTDGENFNRDIYISENQCSREEFGEICRRNKNKNKCHHFRVIDDGILEWAYSKGSIDDLEKYRSKKHFVNELQLFDYENDNNINVITGEPGMGKSILMKKFKNNYFPKFWTILIIVKHHSQYFEEENRNANDFIKYILDQTSNLTEFDKSVENILRKKFLITFLWDGLDELPDENLDSCIKIIKKLSEKGFIQWMTTRNHLEKKLQDRFNVFSKAIIPFDVEQQRIYIEKRLYGINDSLNEISAKIKNYITIVQYNDILGIPLQIFMLTELFIQNLEKYEILLKDLFSIAKLFEHFVDEKFNIYFKEKAELMADNRQRKAIIKDIKTRRLNSHEHAALGAIFDVKTLKELNVRYEQNFDEIEECFAIGIIVGLTEEKKKKFLHQSYAEYFVATYFRKNLETIGGKIKNIIFQDRFRNIRFMFDQLLADDSLPHLAVIYKNLEVLKNCHNLGCKDKAGRNLLHLACSWGARYPLLKSEKLGEHFIIDDRGEESSVNVESEDYKNMMKLLLCECDPREKDRLFAMDSLAYADRSLCLLPIVMLLPTQEKICFSQFENFRDICTVVYYAIKFDYDIILETIKNIPFIETQTGYSLVYFSAFRNSVNCLRKLLKCQKFKSLINQREQRYGKTPSYAACQYGHLDLVKTLIENNANINAASDNGFTPFCVACTNGHYEMAKILIENNADINAASNEGFTPFFGACLNGHYDIVKFLIDNNVNINTTINEGFTPFYAACQSGHYEVVKLLIDNNANINAANSSGITPLYVGCQNGHYDVVNLLIKNNAKINLASNEGFTPFFAACQSGHYEVFKLLIDNNANINVANNSGITPLYLGCQNGHYDVVKLLIKNNAKINVASNEGFTPFFGACQNGHYEVVKLLIENNAKINAASNEGFTPFFGACQRGHYEVVKILIENNVKINAANSNGVTPFYVACQNGHYEVVKLLIENNAKINAASNEGFTPFYAACQRGHYEVVKILIENNVKINAANSNGVTPFYVACQNGHHEVVKLLIANNADINVASKEGFTPLFGACENGHYEVVKLLVENNAKINAASNEGFTPFFTACENGRYEVVKLLIEKKAKINVASDEGFTPFFVACENGHVEVVKLLIENNAKINAASNEGFTPFFAACQNGHYEVVKLLIDNNANIHVTIDSGVTPLIIACQNGHYNVVKLLIENNAKINVASNEGFISFYVACQNGHYEVVKLLIDNNAININAANINGVTPFYVACQNGHVEIVKLLIENNAKINAATNEGFTPFFGACQNGHYEVVKLLIDNNANINVTLNNGVTSFYIACQNGHYDVVKLLISNNAKINAASNEGFISFYVACQNGHYEVVKLLIDNNAININAANSNGVTPLYVACQNGHYEVVKLLIENNAKINAATNEGITPFYGACENGHHEVVKLLIDNNADVNAARNDGITPFYIANRNGHHEVVKLLKECKANRNVAKKRV